ncbi:hypothetical protein B7P43_G03052 [Cryptotermes secundus]|uniref:Uncharacterized protein n=1 Tax=Cryptotermes secundus TaxID=105785 RepID=A0A2J7Q4Y0_9NEOP|nr:uncharacterized protein LOC111869799 isoform X2 [Cryptotermes secundus]PNF23642.1 hypothetical protein B7P43_G03052 [Cryptotermes secundus]
MPNHHWIPCDNGKVPMDAFICGMDKDGSSLYVGRAFHEGDLLPGKIVPSHGCIYVCRNGAEHGVKRYEALVGGNFAWTNTSGNRIPRDAVAAGETATKEKLYVGRVVHDGTLTIGKVHPSHGVCYIPYDGKELSFQVYDILVSK